MKKFFARLFARWAIKKIFTWKPKETETQVIQSDQYSFDPPVEKEFWKRFMWFRERGFSVSEMGSSTTYMDRDPVPSNCDMTGNVHLQRDLTIPVKIRWSLYYVYGKDKMCEDWTARIDPIDESVKNVSKAMDFSENEKSAFKDILNEEDFRSTLVATLKDPENDLIIFLNNFVQFLETFSEKKAYFVQKKEEFLEAKKYFTGTPDKP